MDCCNQVKMKQSETEDSEEETLSLLLSHMNASILIATYINLVKVKQFLCQKQRSNAIGNWMSDEKAPLDSRALLHSWLNKILKVKISDGRRLVGSFLCTDQDMNIILGSCQEYVHGEDFENEDPRILGLAMVPGKHIVSLEIDQETPVQGRQNSESCPLQGNQTEMTSES